MLFASHTVASALSDPYYSVSAGLNGLAGPLHGLANQECLKFVLSVKEKIWGVPNEKDLEQYCWNRLESGRVIPKLWSCSIKVCRSSVLCLYQIWATKH